MLNEVSQAMELHPTLWVKKYGIKNESGIPIEFDSHKFLYDIYNDMSPFQVVLKPPQIGMTVLEVIKSLWCAKKKGWDIIYTLPTQADVNDMAGGKINRIIAQNPILKTWVENHDTVEQKSVGKNIIYYRGTFSQKQAMMVSSDLNIHDEVDASDSTVIQQYETRLQAKSDGKRWYFSHPSLAGFGVDIYWQQSDKKEWYVKCPICEAEQVLTYPDNIDEIRRIYICSYCKQEMSDDTRKKGEWKKTAEGTFSGYHISQLMCPWISADKILKDKEEKEDQYFWNYVLGLPYASSDNKLQSKEILQNVSSKVNSQGGRIIIGVDTGLPIHYVFMNKEGIFHYGRCSDPTTGKDPYQELESFLIRYPNAIMVSDQGGDLIGIRNLQARYPGRVFLAYYRKDRKTKDLIKWGEGDQFGTVVVDRNRMIQLLVEQMRDTGRFILNGTREEWAEYASHYANIYREIKTSKSNPGKDDSSNYGVELIWKRMGPDHYVHATVYALVGFDRYKEDQAKIIEPNSMYDGVLPGRSFNFDAGNW